MPQLSPLINIDSLNAAYQILKRQMDERVYKSSINPDEILGSMDYPYPQAYIKAINNENSTWYILNNGKASFEDTSVNNLIINGSISTSGESSGTVGFESINCGDLNVLGTATAVDMNLTGDIHCKNLIADETINSSSLNNTGALTSGSIVNNGSLTSQTITSNGLLTGQSITSNSTINASGNITTSGEITGSKVYNAVWNDIADAINVEDQIITFEPGYAYAYDGRKWFKTKNKKSSYFGIHSDTAGYVLGYNKDRNQILIAIAGFVLAYVDNIYPSGTWLTYTENGWLTKAKRSDEKIAKFFKEEKEKIFNGIEVNGRCWVKIV